MIHSVYEALTVINGAFEPINESGIDGFNNRYLYQKSYEYLKESIVKESKCDYPYAIAPYFTKMEIEDLQGYYSDTELPVNADDFDPIKFDMNVRGVFSKIAVETNTDKIDTYKQTLVNLGWNPEVEYTLENRLKAVERQTRILNETNNTMILDLTSVIENMVVSDHYLTEAESSSLKPIHIILVKGMSTFSDAITKVTKSEFSHSAICIDNDFTKCYSFNLNNKVNKYGGFSIENVFEYPKDGRLAIFTFFIKDSDHKKLKEVIEIFKNKMKDTSYSTLNIIALPFKTININMSNSMICSQFVDSILKTINIDILNKNSAHVVPGDFYRLKVGKKNRVYKTYDGIVSKFSDKKINKFISKMVVKAKAYKENGSIVDDFLNPYVIEAELPISVKSNGDVLLKNPFVDFDVVYSESHKLLIEYTESGNLEGLKYELARMYYLNYMLEKRLYHNAQLSNRTKNMNTRARVLNDFKKYMKVVLEKEPSFNFGEYYQQTEFYPHTVTVDKHTAIAVKDIIKHILL